MTSGQAKSPDDVTIWLFDLRSPGSALPRFARVLSADEHARADRFVQQRHRERYVVAHGAVRCILGQTLGRDPADLAFTVNPWGKPELAGQAPDAGVPFFNLSHTDDLGALAIGWRCPVGVDIETVRPIEPDVAKLSFSPAEQVDLALLHDTDWLQGFYRCWTRKEAVIKALGLGLAQPLDAFDVTLLPDAPPRLLRLEGQPTAPAHWQLAHFQPADDILGAFAAPLSGHQLAFRRWTPDQA